MDHKTSSEFFDGIYAQAAAQEEAIPWQQAISRRLVADWFGSHRVNQLAALTPKRAIVVAAGLGDDAGALVSHGFEVTAFDFSPTAVDWARKRHHRKPVDWQVADLFSLPGEWANSYDLVFEVFTIQSIHPDRQVQASDSIRSLLRPGGSLVAVALVHDNSITPSGPPWPLPHSTIEHLTDGLQVAHRYYEPVGDHVDCVLLELFHP